MNLSPHFTLQEATLSRTAVQYGLSNVPPPSVLENMKAAAEQLEVVRALLQTPIIVTSWFRALPVDRLIGGSGSATGHSSGWCIDFHAPPLDIGEICVKIADAGLLFDQLIHEGTWVHISFHPQMRQMLLTAIFTPGKRTTYREGVTA